MDSFPSIFTCLIHILPFLLLLSFLCRFHLLFPLFFFFLLTPSSFRFPYSFFLLLAHLPFFPPLISLFTYFVQSSLSSFFHSRVCFSRSPSVIFSLMLICFVIPYLFFFPFFFPVLVFLIFLSVSSPFRNLSIFPTLKCLLKKCCCLLYHSPFLNFPA